MSKPKHVIVAAGGGPTDDRREAIWKYTQPRWAALGPVYVGEINDPDMEAATYNRAEAINDGAERATEAVPDWETIIVIDRDVVVPRAQVGNAIIMSSQNRRAALPYRRYHPLTEKATNDVLAGGEPPKHSVQVPPGILTTHVSSCIVVPRFLWDMIGGFDIRFVGWGGEDRAFHAACKVLGGGIENVDGIVYHLWHQPTGGPSSPNYRANKALQDMYLKARTPEAMHAVIHGLV